MTEKIKNKKIYIVNWRGANHCVGGPVARRWVSAGAVIVREADPTQQVMSRNVRRREEVEE